MGSCRVTTPKTYRQSAKMSLWKVMTMSQVARQGAQAYEAQAAGRFVWGKEGFKWMSDSTSSSQDNSSECSSSSEQQSQFSSSHEGVTAGRYNSNQHQPSF